MRGLGVRQATLFVAFLTALLLVWSYRAPLGRAAFAAVLDVATGGRAAFDSVSLGRSEAIMTGVRFTYAGVPLLTARRLAVGYDLRALLPGGDRRFGLERVSALGPAVVLVRRADGSFALPWAGTPGRAGAAESGGGASGVSALRFEIEVRGGSLTLLDPARVLAGSRRFTVGSLAVSASVDGAAATIYRARGLYDDNAAYPLTLAGRVDAKRGFAQHRLGARALPLGPLVNYFINTPAAAFDRAPLRDLDLRAYAFARGHDIGPYHVAGSARLEGGAMNVPGLLAGASAMRGRVDLYDNGIAAPAMTARLGTTPIRLTGGLYDWRGPQFRLAASGTSDLGSLRALFRFSRRLPIRGPVRLATLLEGPVGTPLVATRAAAPALHYAAFPIADGAGRAIFHAGSVDLVGLGGRYGGLAVAVDGAVDLGAAARTQLVLAAGGGTARVPYLAQAMPGARLAGQALLDGVGQRFEIRGALGGAGGDARLSGLFFVDAAGDGALGPFELEQRGGGVAHGSFNLRRSASESGFWLTARDYRMSELTVPARLPGLALAAPAFSGRLSGALAGEGPPSRFRIAGRAAGRDVRVGAITLTAVAGDVTGALDAVSLARVTAYGRWGSFAGRGAYTAQRLALEGRYRGDFAGLVPFTGDLGGRGPLAGPVALLIEPVRTVVQARDANAAGSRVRGLPLERLSGTIDARRGELRVYGATARVAGGTAVAAGTLAASSALAFSVAGADGAGAIAVPGLVPGNLTAVGSVALRGRGVEFDGGAAVAGARFDGIPLAGNGDVAFGKTRLALAATDAIAGPAVGSVRGTVAQPGTPAAVYDLAVRVPATALGPLARALASRVPYLVGTVGARFRLRGRANAWAAAGGFDVPEGSVNGLGFEALSGGLNVSPAGIDVRRGRARVGSTEARFDASSYGADASLRLDAPRADLADFNDFFDAGDTLGGRGRIAARFTDRRSEVGTSADVAIAGLHYRRFDLGDAVARLASSGKRVRGRVSFGGLSGTLATSGTLLLARAPLPELFARSRFDGTAHLAGLDVGVWLPALGYQLPVTGRIDADATIHGRLADPDVATTATLAHGSIGALPVDRLVLRATSTRARTTVRQAELSVPSLDAELSGSFGLGRRDPLALSVHAKSTNIGALAARLSLGDFGASGIAEADVKIEGTRELPRVTGGFDVERAIVHGVAVPQALGQFSLHGRDVVLSGVEVQFATGTLALAGSFPLQIAPLRFGPPQAPFALDVAAAGIDLASFAPLLPAGSTLAGRVDGRVGFAGTAGDPRLSGSLALDRGVLRTPYETIPLEQLEARLAFNDHEVRLQRLQARAGSGTLAASGYADLPNLAAPGQGATYDFNAHAEHAVLNFPAYGGGSVTSTMRLSHLDEKLPLLSGDIELDDAAIPFSSLLGASGAGASGTGGPAGAPRNAALNLALVADRNVRVRSANVDIGTHGSVQATGTFAAPVLAGAFASTGGTLSYFNTVFRLVNGTVTFEPDLGVIPVLDARAVTHVIDPDPNTVRNAAGSADITLALSGPVNALSISLDSNPSYDRQQILGLLLNAPAFGATNLFGETAQNPTYYGSTNTAALSPSVVTSRNESGELSVAQEAFGIANAQFTRTLLAPFETTFAGALGLSNFNLNVDYTGNVGLSARKVLGKDINAIYDTSFGYPYRQTFGFEIKPNEFEAAQVTVFQTLGAYDLNSLAPTGYLSSFNSKVRAAQPEAGSSGFSLSIQRLFP